MRKEFKRDAVPLSKRHPLQTANLEIGQFFSLERVAAKQTGAVNKDLKIMKNAQTIRS
jgi:hypothetical protein